MSSIPQNHCDENELIDCVQRFFSRHHVSKLLARPVFRRSTRKFPAFLFFSFFVSSSVPRFFLYLQQIFNALSGLFLLEKFF